MGDERLEQTREWLIKAENDRRSARALAALDDPLLDTAAFHCQQAVEKAFKAFLTYHGRIFEKTHLLGILCDLCAAIDANFGGLRESADTLTDYAVAFRYPGEEDATLDEVRTALATVDEVWAFVLHRLPDELRELGRGKV